VQQPPGSVEEFSIAFVHDFVDHVLEGLLLVTVATMASHGYPINQLVGDLKAGSWKGI
jgi:hypothetical protein